MRAAPPVGITVSNGGAWRGIHGAWAALAGGVAAAWVLEVPLADPTRTPLLAAAAIAAAALAAGASMLRWQRPRRATLHWDGGSWLADGAPVRLDVMLAFDRWLLLRCRGGGTTCWLAVPAAEAGAAWPALRAALFAPQAAGLPGPR